MGFITTVTGEFTFIGSYDEIKRAEKVLSGLLLDEKPIMWKEYLEKYINPFLPIDRKIETDPTKIKGWSKNTNSDEQINFDADFPIKFAVTV